MNARLFKSPVSIGESVLFRLIWSITIAYYNHITNVYIPNNRRSYPLLHPDQSEDQWVTEALGGAKGSYRLVSMLEVGWDWHGLA